MKYRIIEGKHGWLYPQHKIGLFWGWRFFYRDANDISSIRVMFNATLDPGPAARFKKESDASEFIERFKNKLRIAEEEFVASYDRTMNGVKPVRIIKK
jgi:hypothetical protein